MIKIIKMPFRETEDYIVETVATVCLKKYKKHPSDIFTVCDLGCGSGIILISILKKLLLEQSNKKIHMNVLDISNAYVVNTVNELQTFNTDILSIIPHCTSVFKMHPNDIQADFLYVFWRRSDLARFSWKDIQASTIVSYKHPIHELEHNLVNTIQSKSIYHVYEKLYVYERYM